MTVNEVSIGEADRGHNTIFSENVHFIAGNTNFCNGNIHSSQRFPPRVIVVGKGGEAMQIIRRDMTMEVVRCPVSNCLEVTNLISVFYSDFSFGYESVGEYHDFWEIVYVDKGHVLTITNDDRFEMRAGQIYVHKPNQYHQHIAVDRKGASVMILAFELNSQDVDFLHCNKRYLSKLLRNDLSRLVGRSALVYKSVQESGRLWYLRPHAQVDRRNEQLFKNALEMFLLELSLWDGKTDEAAEQPLVPSPLEPVQTLYQAVCEFFSVRLYMRVTLDEVCHRFGYSKTALSAYFRKNAGTGPMQLFNRMKIEKARELLDGTQKTVTEISYILGFSSPQYFARVFHRHLGLSPREYLQTINKKKSVLYIPK